MSTWSDVGDMKDNLIAHIYMNEMELDERVILEMTQEIEKSAKTARSNLAQQPSRGFSINVDGFSDALGALQAQEASRLFGVYSQKVNAKSARPAGAPQNIVAEIPGKPTAATAAEEVRNPFLMPSMDNVVVEIKPTASTATAANEAKSSPETLFLMLTNYNEDKILQLNEKMWDSIASGSPDEQTIKRVAILQTLTELKALAPTKAEELKSIATQIINSADSAINDNNPSVISFNNAVNILIKDQNFRNQIQAMKPLFVGQA